MRAWSAAEVLEITGVVRHGDQPKVRHVAPLEAPSPATRWLEQAACRGRPTWWWYPTQGNDFASAVARSVCRGCVVRSECLEAALVEEAQPGEAPFGIRGGLTAEARQRLLRRRA